MYGYYYKAGKSWEDVKLWEATKDNLQEDVSVESFLKQDNYWNIGSFLELAKEMQLVLKADYSFPIILDEEYKLVDGAHRLVHAYLDGITHIKGVIIRNNQWPEPDYDELKELKKKEDFQKNNKAMKELDELKEKCVQAMQDVDNFVSEHYDELCNEIREQWNVPEDWIVKIVSNCGIVHGCYRQSDKDKWFRVIYNNGFWLDNNFL